jgi:hypothetical protein
MARNRTLAELQQEVYELADVDLAYIDEPQMTRMINASLAELYDLVVASNKDHYAESTNVNVTSGTDSYTLAADHYRLVGVDIYDSGAWHLMKRFNIHERNQLQDGDGSEGSTSYRVVGGALKLRPTPTWSGTVRVWYIPAPPQLSLDTDTWDGIAGWEQYVVIDCCLKLGRKQKEDITELISEKASLAGRIKGLCCDLDDNEPDRVRDVYLEEAGTYPAD